MKATHARWRSVAGPILATALMAPPLCAQSSDALLQKLVEKGVLTTAEAESLKNESKDDARKNWVKGAGMPDWVKSMQLYGDFRGRFEQHHSSSEDFIERNRFRYRLRLGAVASFEDKFEIGFRAASANPVTTPGGTLAGGSPVSANQDLNSLESRKFLWIDAAYARWNAVNTDSWTLAGTIGKMDNPFQLSNMVWDYDINPEGAALQSSYKIDQRHQIRGTAAFYVLDELNQGNPSGSTLPAGTNIKPTHDPYLYGVQAVLESKWTSKIESAIGIAAFSIDNTEALSAKAQPFYNAGNTRDANGFLKQDYNPIIGSAAATYKFASAPFYPGEFPVRLGGEFMDNPGAPENNQGWRLGLVLGKAGKKRSWEIGYRYQRLEADAWFDALADDDNGAFYGAGNPQLTGTGRAAGWFGGTNVRGHQVTATYSITDFMNFTFIYYSNETILQAPGEKNDGSHFMADLNWRF